MFDPRVPLTPCPQAPIMLIDVMRSLSHAVPRRVREPLRKAYHWNVGTRMLAGPDGSDAVATASAAWRTFGHAYGYLRSLRERACVDATGAPVPWFTYPAIEFLNTLDMSACRVFEYGAGNSTRYWAARAARVDAVESSPEWHARIAPTLPAHCSVALETTIPGYIDAVRRDPAGYDVIVVDGQNEDRGRERCAAAAVEVLRPGGMVVLDDAAALPRSCTVLREAGLIEVPMSGFSPLNAYPNTTAFYLRRDFAIPRRHPERCAWPVGAPHNVWEGDTLIVDAPPPPLPR